VTCLKNYSEGFLEQLKAREREIYFRCMIFKFWPFQKEAVLLTTYTAPLIHRVLAFI